MILACVLATAGCGSPPTPHRRPSMEEWTASVRKAPAGAPAEEAARQPAAPAAPPSVAPPPVAKALPTSVVSDLDLAGATDLATVLRIMAKSAGVNLLVSPNVTGTVSLTFREVPWDEAFRSVLASGGLSYAWDGDVLRVMTIDDMKKELEIETIQKERETVRAEMRRIEPLGVEVIKVRYAKAASLGAAIRTLLSRTAQDAEDKDAPHPQAVVTVDEENNSIIVHATESEVAKARSLIAQLDRRKPQVRIEARIVEATRDAARQLGVQWGGQRMAMNGQRVVTVGGAGVTSAGYLSDFSAPFAQDLSRPYGFTLGVLSERFGGSELLSMQLTALQRDGEINIVSSPSVTTLDNETAIIESGEERAYRKTTGTGNILDVSLEWKKAVLKLEVTPHVIDDRQLKLEIVANKDSFDETKPQTNGEYPVSTKHASTTVVLLDGQTAVIGGLAREANSEASSGIPWLKDMPWLGRLFSNDARASLKDDTMIFITPHILAEGE